MPFITVHSLLTDFFILRDKSFSFSHNVSDNLPYEKIGKNEPVCIADEVPFDIPESWEWVRLRNIIYNHGQVKPEQDFCYIDIGSVDNLNQKLNADETIITPKCAPSRARKVVVQGDIIYSTVRPYLHNMCIIDKSFSKIPIASTGFAVLTCHADFYNEFLFYYMMSPDFDAYANDTENSKGVAYPAINDSRLYMALIPVPPIEEQHRIISKLKEILPEIKKYHSAESQLHELNATFPNVLKKSILQEAVQGKLVPQDLNDEPASVLLERIRAEKEQLIKEGKIKRDKHESVIFRRDNSYYEVSGETEVCIDDEIPFEIPESWVWIRLGTALIQTSTGPFGSMIHKEEYVKSGVPIVNPANIVNGKISAEKVKRVSHSTATRLSNYMLKEFDVIIGRRGEMGRSAVVTNHQEGWLCGTGCFFVCPSKLLLPDYLVFLLDSPVIKKALTEKSVGTTMSNLNHSILQNLLIAVPPRNEQLRIMAYYRKITSLLDE